MCTSKFTARFILITLICASLAASLPAWGQGTPATVGQWASVQTLPNTPVHGFVLPNGKVLFWGSFQGSLNPYYWDPTTGSTTAATTPNYEVFCAGQTLMPDGRLLITGGNISNEVGYAHASIYDWTSNTWIPLPDMNAGRWYPTNTELANGDTLVVSGNIDLTSGVNITPQVWQNSTQSWRTLSTAQLAMPLYPVMYMAPNGKVFNAAPNQLTRYLDPTGTGAWTVVGNSNFGYRDYGSSVLYDTGKILIAGGGDPPTASAETIDLTAQTPTWQYTGSMAYSRRQMNATLLPDGTVLVTGGSSGAGFDNAASPIYPAELWNPATGQFTTMASFNTYRGYHSVALLLPDGRVWSAGGNVGGPSYEIFSPPYLFNGAQPSIASAPSQIHYGDTIFVGTPDAASISQVTFLRLGSVTHSFNQDQRINRLTFSQASGGLNINAPTNPVLTPPGNYMLFILNSSGVPSVASIMNISSPVVLSPDDLSFPSQLEGTTSAPQTVTVTNQGTATLNLSGVSASGDYGQTNNCGNQLAPGASCTVTVTFTPTSTGTRTGSISVSDNAADSPQMAQIVGTGVSSAGLSASIVQFPAQILGTTSAPQNVTLTNLGSVTLNLSSITASGDFAQTNNCPAAIAPGSNCTISITFTPTTGGIRTGSVLLTDDAQDSPQTISLSGVGISSVNLSFGGLNFANQNVGTTSPAQAVILTNNGSATLNIASIVASANFGVSNNCGTQVAAGGTCTLNVTFTPLTGGTLAGSVTINDDALGSPQNIATLGVGVSSVSLSPTSLTFGNQLVGTTSAPQSITVANQGGAAVGMNSITTSGDFTATNNCGASIGAGASCTVSVSFTPTTGGSRQGTLSLSDGAAGSPQTALLSGVGLAPPSLPVLLGDQKIEGLITNPSRNRGWAFQATGLVSGTLASLTLYLDRSNTATIADIGIYSDNGGHPGTLLTQVSSNQLTNGAWNTFQLQPSSQINITSGQPYWIAVVGPTVGTLKIAVFTHGLLPQYCHSESSAQSTLSNSLPATWQTGTIYSACPISAYGLALASTPVLGVTPQNMTFSAVQNIADPAPAPLNITNNGQGSLTYAATSDQPWLNFSPASGTAPQTIQVAPTVAGLAPGSYVGHVTLNATGALSSPTVVPVTFNVAPPPALTVTPTTLSFSSVQGAPAPPPATINVMNVDLITGTLNFTISSDSAWLTSATSGSTPQDVQIFANNAGLNSGTYTGHLTISPTGVQASPSYVTVTLTVAPAPVLSLSASTINFNEAQGGPDPSATTLNVNNAGGGTISYTANSDSAWLSATPTSGPVPQGVQVSVTGAGLTPGTYTGHVSVGAAGATNTPQSTTVNLTIGPPPSLAASSTKVNFNEAQGGADPAGSSVNITNSGAGSLSFTATSDSPWLNVTPGSGNAPQALQISVTGAGMQAGVYNGHITVTGNAGVQNSPLTIAVSLTISQVIIGDQSVESVIMFPSRGRAQAFQATALGTGTLSSLSLYLDKSNTGTNVAIGLYNDNGGHPGTLLAQASSAQLSNGAWNTYAISPTGITAGQPYWIAVIGPPTGSLEVHVQQHALSPQFCHSETSSQTNLTTSFPSTWSSGTTYSACPISAYGSVSPSQPQLIVTPQSFSFSAPQNAVNIPAGNLAVANGGQATLNFTTASDSAWLTPSPASGAAPQTVPVTVSPSGLNTGTYTGNVTIASPGSMGAPAVVPVTFTVTPAVPPSMALSASTLSLNEAQGGPDPAASTVALSNTGAGLLTYTAVSDSNWLSVSPASGSAPQNLQISVAGAGLLAGTYTGHVTVTGGAGVLNSPLTITVTFTISPVIIGDQAIEPALATATKGRGWAFQATGLGTGSLTSMSLYLDKTSTGTTVSIGLYNDNNGHPGTLLGQSSSTQAVSGAWNTYSFPATSITAGQPYWIAVIGPPTGTLVMEVRQHALSPQFCHSESSSQNNLTTTFPATWSSGSTFSACPLSAYGSLAVVAATLSVTSPTLSFSEVQGGPDPSAFTANVANSGGGTMSFTAGSDSPWLTAAPASAVAPRSLQISVAGAGMQPGTYNGNITVTAAGALNSPVKLPVTFTIAPPPSLSIDNTSLTFNEPLGGPDPSAQTANISNTGGGTLTFTAVSDSTWLTAGPGNGTAPQALQISVAGSGMTAGAYTGHVTVTGAAGVHNSPLVITVSFTIAPPPSLSIDDTTLTFNEPVGGPDPSAQTANVSNTGGGTLNFTAQSDSAWLSVLPTSGAAPQALQISVAGSSLASGTYTGNITVTAPGAQNSPVVIGVTLNVQ